MNAQSAAALIQSLDSPLQTVKGSRLHRSTSLTQLLDCAAIIHQRITEKRIKAVDLASLARALCLVDERIRIRRGIPLPGMLRPDLDAVSNAKRGKRGKVIELVEEPREAPETPTPAAATDARQTTAQTPAAETANDGPQPEVSKTKEST